MSKKNRTRAARLRAEATAIERRLERAVVPNMTGPVLGRANIAYELSARTKATAHGGIGAIAKLIGEVGLASEIDSSLQLLKLHKPYHESDHVLNIAYNPLCGGTRLDDIETRRTDAVFVDGSGGREPPRPDHRRRLLPPLRRALDHGAAGGDQPDSAEGLVPTARLVLRPDRPHRRGRLDRVHRRAVQAGDGHLLQRHLGLLGAGGLAGQHRRAAVSVPARRATGPPTKESSPSMTGRSSCAGGRVHRRPAARRHRLLARPSSTAGTATGCASCSATTPRPTS